MNIQLSQDEAKVVDYQCSPLNRLTTLGKLPYLWILLLGGCLIVLGTQELLKFNFRGILFFAFGTGLSYLGWKGRTCLLIRQKGGDKHLLLRGKDSKLIRFVGEINKALS